MYIIIRFVFLIRLTLIFQCFKCCKCKRTLNIGTYGAQIEEMDETTFTVEMKIYCRQHNPARTIKAPLPSADVLQKNLGSSDALDASYDKNSAKAKTMPRRAEAISNDLPLSALSPVTGGRRHSDGFLLTNPLPAIVHHMAMPTITMDSAVSEDSMRPTSGQKQSPTIAVIPSTPVTEQPPVLRPPPVIQGRRKSVTEIIAERSSDPAPVQSSTIQPGMFATFL